MLAFDAASTSNTTGTSLTFAHTCTGSNRILIVGVTQNGTASSLVTGITYNGVAMTHIVTRDGATNNWASLWYLIAPATGANNIVITASGSVSMVGFGSSYTGADQTTQPNASSSNTVEGATSLETSITPTKNTWVVSCTTIDGNTLSAGTNVTQRSADATPRNAIGDSNAIVTGTFSQTWTRSASGRLVTAQAAITDIDQPTGGFFYTSV